MAAHRLLRQISLGAGLLLLTGVFLAVNSGWSPQALRGQTSSTCSDSDGGLNFETVGNVIDDSRGYVIVIWDTCADSRTLAEAYCGPDIQMHTCPALCDRGMCTQTVSSSSQPSCTDSDRGLDYYTQGSVMGPDGTTTNDVCVDNWVVAEAYCAASGQAVKMQICPEVCKGGRCVRTSSSSSSLVPPSSSSSSSSASSQPICTDTDSGLNYFIWGAVTGPYGERTDDVCMGSQTLAEAYCSASGPDVRMINCPGRCEAGKCIGTFSSSSQALCVDSDNGLDYFASGSVTGENGARTDDVCTDDRTVAEAYCSTSGPMVRTQLCPGLCRSGRCVQASSASFSFSYSSSSSVLCTDSDGGLEYFTCGTVTGPDGAQTDDVCVDNKTLSEKFCNGSTPDGLLVLCPEMCVKCACASCPSKLIVYMDVSGSMGGTKATATKNGVKLVVNKAKFSKMTIVPFSDRASKRTFSIPSERNAAINYINSFNMNGFSTNYLDALKAADIPSDSVGIFISDGEPNEGGGPNDILDYIRTHIDGRLYTISVKCPIGSVAERLLMDMAEINGGTFTRVEDTQLLEQTIVELTESLCKNE